MFKDILTFLGLGYRDASRIAFSFIVLGISIPKSDQSDNFIISKFIVKKIKNQHF